MLDDGVYCSCWLDGVLVIYDGSCDFRCSFAPFLHM